MILPIHLRTDNRLRLRKTTGDEKYYAPLERQEHSLFRMILFSIYTPFRKLWLFLTP